MRAPWLMAALAPAVLAGVALPAQDTASTTPIPVFLTVSGGISKGSHQAGVNWALLRLIRGSVDAAFRTRHALPDVGYVMGGMTGASAGNINSVLTAFEWCRAEPEPDPRRSLFWQHWIPTGFSDLVPPGRASLEALTEGGLVDRARFRASHLPQLTAFASGAEAPLRDCAVPIGITVTRQGYDSTRVFDALYIPSSRYATTFEVRATPGGRITLSPYAADDQLAHFGERLWPAPLDAEGHYPLASVFDVVAASAAFPIAFAPQRLRYVREANCLATGCAPDSALFLDGGVFDNNPVDLTIGIRRRAVADGRSLTVYIDPDHRRSPVRGVDSVVVAPGLAGMVRTIHAMVQAGRAADIAAVAKAVDLDSALFDMPHHPLMRTDREFVIAGAELGGFGAFLGRPLRGFDFYVGLYDGLAFAARHMTGARDTAGVAARVLAFIEDESVVAYAEDRAFLRQLWAEEFERAAPASTHGLTRDAASAAFDARLLRTLLTGSLAARAAAPRPPCAALSLLGKFYCGSALPYFTAAIATDPTLIDSVRAAADATASLVDEDFARYVFAPEERLQALANRLIERLYQSERAMDSPQWAHGASAAGLYLNQAYLGQPRTIFEARDVYSALDPSTIPAEVPRLRCLRCLAPYRVTLYPAVSGIEAEYRPTLRLASGVGVHLSLTPWVWHRPEPSATVDPQFGVPGHVTPRTYWAVGGGVVWQRGTPIFTGVEAGWRAYRPYRRPLNGFAGGYVHALDLGGHFLLGRLQIGVRYFPDNFGRAVERESRRWGGPVTLNAGMPFALYVAMPDVPGLLYWFLPR